MNILKPVDHAALGTNQAVIISLIVLAFVLNSPALVGVVGAFMLLGTLLGKPGFGWLYSRALRPLGWVKPDVLQDHPEPHRFAQGFGAVVVAFGFAALLAGMVGLGWTLAWIVAALAALNLFAGFCVGCAVYYWLSRLGLPGFVQTPPSDRMPGKRPERKANHVS